LPSASRWFCSSPPSLPPSRCRCSTSASWRLPVAGLHLLVSLCLLFGLQWGYRQLNGRLSQRPPAYLHADGFFKLGAWAPLLKAEDAPSEVARAVLEEPSPYPLADRRLRRSQLWSPDGLVERLKRRVGDSLLADELAGEMAQRAARRDPLGVLRLVTKTYLDFWDPAYRPVMLKNDIQSRPLGTLAGTLGEQFGFSTAGYPKLNTPAARYYRASSPGGRGSTPGSCSSPVGHSLPPRWSAE
jgi:hypothetical protein